MDMRHRTLPGADQRCIGSHGHRHFIAGLSQMNEPDGISRRLVSVDIAAAGGDAQHPHVRAFQGKQDGDGVVDPGIAVNEHFYHGSTLLFSSF